MPYITGVIHPLRQFVDGVEILGIGLPTPLNTRQHGIAADVFGPFQVAENIVDLFLAAGRQGKAAITHDDRGNAVIAGAGSQRIPKNLRVHVGVSVDEARCDHVALGIHDFIRRRVDAADPGNLAVLHANIGAVTRAAGTIDYHAVLNDQIVTHSFVSPGQISNCRRRMLGTA